MDAARGAAGAPQRLHDGGISHELVRQGRSVYFSLVCELMERLLVAKKDLRFTKEQDIKSREF